MKEILKEKSAASFYRKVMAYVRKYDNNFSKLSLYFQKTETGGRLKMGNAHFACCVDTLPRRKTDYDDSVTWTYGEKSYCLYLEFTRADLESAFIPKFNTAYTNDFSIEKNADEYILLSSQENIGKIIDRKNLSDGARLKVDFLQKILFGAPGTGKSFKIDDPENGYGLKNVDESRKFRTTFHPDYDYAQFIGAYKPRKKDSSPDEITYSFVPQVFAKAYATAWKQYISADKTSTADNQVYLVIEEINRGNCAQIFGDIFQLLDRDSEGFSQYSIDADCDFAEWLETSEDGLKSVLSAYVGEVGEGKLMLPPNLNILATMNTSDQSLFPMDSAFKRRFDWEYVPINYKESKADFTIGDDSFNFSWLTFLKKVNADIYKVTESEDKQMGVFFIKPKNDKNNITLDEFRSKVLFYLWDSVYKDEVDRKNVFRFGHEGSDVTFQRLFADDFPEILRQMLKNLDEAYKDGEFKDLKILNE